MEIMSPLERDYTMKLIGDFQSKELLFKLHEMSRYKRKMQIFEYLIKQNITGRTLFEEIKKNYENSTFLFVAEITKRMDRDVAKRQMFLGKHWS